MNICVVQIAEVSESSISDVGLLEAAEKQRALQFVKLMDRLRFLTGRLIARQLIADLTGRTPTEVVVRTRCKHCGSETHGKPYGVHPSGILPLSIAHSAARVLVATTNGPDVGADIEIIDETRFNDRVLEQLESEREYGLTRRDAAAFTRLWAHKEAALKCTGDGLMLSPKALAIDFSQAPPSLQWIGRSGEPIRLASLDTIEGYAAAVAVRGTNDFAVKLRRTGF